MKRSDAASPGWRRGAGMIHPRGFRMLSKLHTPARMTYAVRASLLAVVLTATALAQQGTIEPSSKSVHPLAAKEEMIRDRFQRFQDRLYRLSEELAEREPENAQRLARALERAGELGLTDKLDDIVRLLEDPASVHLALDQQDNWLGDADALLSILLERDSANEQRRNQIETLEKFRQEIGKLLEQERGLRSASEQSAAAAKMKQQLDQALRVVANLARKHGEWSQDGAKKQESGGSPEKAAPSEEALAKEAKELAEQVQRIAETPSDESESLKQAREQSQAAAQFLQSASQSMSDAADSLQRRDPPTAEKQQQQADKSLQQAREHLEAAKKALEQQQPSAQMAQKQRDTAQQTKSLGQQMQQQSSSAGKPSGGKPGESTPGQKNVEQAEKEMNDASESLDQQQPDQAQPKQDRAVDQLELAEKELEEKLQQLRKEEREETLRDLEARFRDMLTRQRPINESTLVLDRLGGDKFKRAEQLQLADLSAAQRAVSEQAAGCLHILDEEGTTIAFPRVVEQLSEDMTASAERLAAAQVGAVTQVIQQEIVGTLEQLLEAVKRMQQENEQGKQGGSSQSGEPPLLPESAELKLLRASQQRVNTRTQAIHTGLQSGDEPQQVAADGLVKLSRRQTDRMDIAREIHDR